MYMYSYISFSVNSSAQSSSNLYPPIVFAPPGWHKCGHNNLITHEEIDHRAEANPNSYENVLSEGG